MRGSTIGHYQIVEKLGAGWMGEVFRAIDTKLGREVALKMLPAELASDPERLERFRREAKALAALDHPGIVTVFSVEESEGAHFLTMQLVAGKTLEELLSEGSLSVDRFYAIALALADALASAHERGVVHRDLKPSNVMIAEDGRLKILDFGLAKFGRSAQAVDSELPTDLQTREGVVMGTLPYMSPELLSRRHSVRDRLGAKAVSRKLGSRARLGDSARYPASRLADPGRFSRGIGAAPRALPGKERRGPVPAGTRGSCGPEPDEGRAFVALFAHVANAGPRGILDRRSSLQLPRGRCRPGGSRRGSFRGDRHRDVPLFLPACDIPELRPQVPGRVLRRARRGPGSGCALRARGRPPAGGIETARRGSALRRRLGSSPLGGDLRSHVPPR